MQFFVLGYDGKDDGALDRRMAVRPAHLAYAAEIKAKGNLLYGVAILDDDGRMIGSAMVVEFDTREAFDAWLAAEPYVTGDVWREITVHPCQVGPAFARPAG